jgi:serine/threonine-protein kinase
VDLLKDIPDAITMLEERGEQASVSAVLQTLGAVLAPTLRRGDEQEPTSGAEGLVSLGRFQLQGELGRGGMGRVLEARDPELRRSVAVKVLVDPSQVTEAQLSRFVAEAQITSQLEHPNIIPVHEMGLSEDGQIYFVMKKVEGRSLGQVIAALRAGDEDTEAVWGRHRLLTAFSQVCNAVAYAHDRGVLHRDLKPDNIMLGPFGQVLLMDWGVARLMGDTSEAAVSEAIDKLTVAHTMDGAAIGTPGFMSPEQSQGRLHLLDGRSDVWSLGAVLYQLLTLLPAYDAPNLLAMLYEAASGPPMDPRERAPERNIPEEVAAVCLRAMASERDDRFTTAAALAAAVEAFLEGSRRREAALQHIKAAEEAWERYGALADEREALLAKEMELAAELEPWRSLEEKAELLALRRRLGVLRRDRVDQFEEVIFSLEQAFSQDPQNADAHAMLASVHYARFEEAEAARDPDGQQHHEQRVRRYDTGGHYTALLKGTGSVTLHTDPPGAEVLCERYDRSADLVWPLVERRVLGTTPLVAVPLQQGSYLLTLRFPGKRDTRYPVFISRGRHWNSGEKPVPLYSDADIGQGMVYVPPGPFVFGGGGRGADSQPRSELWVEGFFLSVLPVTMEDYFTFINVLAQEEPEEAWARLIRKDGAIPEWKRPAPGEPYLQPALDAEGTPWNPRWPVNAICWDDAQAYAAWRSERDGVPWSLPTSQQWEKAARGTDGRIFPWGDDFDPALCKIAHSRKVLRQLEPVGAFPSDVSPYGGHDLAGGVRDFCGEDSSMGRPEHCPIRGGSWTCSDGAPVSLELAVGPREAFMDVGFRIGRAAARASSEPEDTG